MRLNLIRILLALICIWPTAAPAAGIRGAFVEAFFLPQESKDKRAWEVACDTPLVDNDRNASWLAFKIVSNGNEIAAVAGISGKGFHIESFDKLPPEEPMSIMGRSLNNTVREYAWSPRGERLVYTVETSENPCEVRFFDPEWEVSEDNPKLIEWRPGQETRQRSSFCFIGDRETDLFYRSGSRDDQGSALCRLGLKGGYYHDRRLIEGKIYDPVHVSKGKKLVYYRQEGNDPGLYEYFYKRNEKKDHAILNIPGSDEKKPKYSPACKRLAFACNHHAGDDNTIRMKDDWGYMYRLFTARIDDLKQINAKPPRTRGRALLDGLDSAKGARLASPRHIKFQDHRNFRFREKNTFKWHGDTLFFLFRDADLQTSIGVWNCNRAGDAHVYNLEKAGEMEGEFQFRGGERTFYYKIDAIRKINNFDVFTSGGSDFLVVSASVSMFNPLTKKEKRLYDSKPERARDLRPDTYKSWTADSIILLFRLSL